MFMSLGAPHLSLLKAILIRMAITTSSPKKPLEITALGTIWGDGNSCALLVGMLSEAAAVENSTTFSNCAHSYRTTQ